jgi:Mg-chelatase subunit ChlI
MSNIYRIVDEEHLIEIVDHNPYKIIVVTFTTQQNHHNEFKKCLIELSSKFKDSIFLYVDINKYSNKGILRVYKIPETIFVFDRKRIVQIDGFELNQIVNRFYEFEAHTRSITNKVMVERIKHVQENIENSDESNNEESNNDENDDDKSDNDKNNEHSDHDHNAKTRKNSKNDISAVIQKLEMVKKTKETEEKIISDHKK